jgi:TldD protein
MLETKLASKVIDCALGEGADFIDLYVERNRTLGVTLKSKRVDQISDGIDFGIGIRVLFGTKVLYGYTNSLEEEELIRITRLLCALDRNPRSGPLPTLSFRTEARHPSSGDAFRLSESGGIEDRIRFLRLIDERARAESPEISQVSASSSERFQEIEIFNSKGLAVSDARFYTRIGAEAVASDGTNKDSAFYGPGASSGWAYTRTLDPNFIASEIARRSLTSLHAEPCPAGPMPVVIDHAFGGVIFHEACGHLLETTSVEKKASVFWDKKGEMIANPAVSAVDDGTLPGAWGSLAIDDEGLPTQRTVLIRNGRLENFMSDYVGELKTGHPRTGSARRQNYRFAPASRMRNTFIEPGPHRIGELIASIDRGLYARSMGGGSVKTGTGEFNFSVQEGYLIENGKITRPVKGATLIGTGPETLKRISMVADNFEIMAGMCGSVSGSIPASVGQPAIKVDEILVGGAK